MKMIKMRTFQRDKFCALQVVFLRVLGVKYHNHIEANLMNYPNILLKFGKRKAFFCLNRSLLFEMCLKDLVAEVHIEVWKDGWGWLDGWMVN